MRKLSRIFKITLYFVFLFALFEGSARLALFLPQISRHLEIWDDYGWRRNWVDRHKNSGEEIYYKFDVFDPTKG